MVIIRESPNAKEPKDQPQWPPRSPHEALLSSPGGRKRLQRIRDGRSISPSPRRSRTTPKKAMSIPSSDSGGEEDEDEDEDEETLQLKLKAIEAKLKLKKLQKAKKSVSASQGAGDRGTESRTTSSTSNRNGRGSALEPLETFEPAVEIPLSPVRRQAPPAEPKSPARTLLGIDKGLKAQDVSLKRPRAARPDSTMNRSNSLRATDASKAKSFSERIAESRLSAQEQQTKEERIHESRSRGFGLQMGKCDVFGSSRPASASDAASRASSRNDNAGTGAGAAKPSLLRANSLREKSTTARPHVGFVQSKDREVPMDTKSAERPLSRFRATTPSNESKPSADADAKDSYSLEPYSGIHLSKRQIDHTTLTRTLQGKELYPIPRLLHEIKGPMYEPPDCESDYVIFGVVCSKSTPRDHINNPKSIDTAGKDEHNRPKFMVFRLTDFKYEIDLFLFDTGFERWWKLKEGQLIAVLNPGVMPPRKKDTDAFSLKVTSSEDTVLEIGQARDLGFCKCIKADGHQCTAWIDKRKTEVCEFHISLQVDKARADRMQFSTMTGGPGTGRGGRGGSLRGSSFGRGRGGRFGKDDGLAKEGMYHDRELHETMWITPKEMGLNAASLLDKEYSDQMQSKEAKRKRDRERAKEEDLARSLGLKANGTGSEYMKHRSSLKATKDRRTTTIASSQTASTSTSIPSSFQDPPDAASLGLLGKTAQQVSLAPVKRKLGSSTTSSRAAPMGWGGAFKRGLLEPPDLPASKNDTSQKKLLISPGKSSLKAKPSLEEGASPRKKARLLLDGKGVRIPGRESLGATPGDVFLQDDDDDDDLEIV